MNPALASPYAISKAGAERMGRALRTELRPHGASASVAYLGFIDTNMVRDTFTDPVARSVEGLAPAFFTRRLSAADAGAAIVKGTERRAPRIIAPRWWSVLSALRGPLNLLMDARMERDRQPHECSTGPRPMTPPPSVGSSRSRLIGAETPPISSAPWQ